MFLLQKPNFPMHMNLINISQKILRRKNYFPSNIIFSPAKSHILISTKMGFSINQPKMGQLHKNTTSSEMVVRGWYTTHFDRRDLLNSEKNVWGGFPNLRGLHGPIRDFSRFFRGFRPRPQIIEKPSSWTSESEKNVRKLIFFKIHSFPKKYDTLAPFWYIYIGHTPNSSGA